MTFKGVYSRISGGISWIQDNVCSEDARKNSDGTIRNLCGCKDSENRIKIETKNHQGKVVFRIKKKGKILLKTKFRNISDAREFCVPKNGCMSLSVKVIRGSGSYIVKANEEIILQDTINGPPETKKVVFSCQNKSHNSHN